MKWKREQTTQNAVWHSGSTRAGWLPGRSAQAAQPRSIHARGSRWQTLTLMNSSAVFGTRKKAVRHFFSVVRPRNGTQKRADFVSMQIKLLLALAHRMPPIHRHMRDQSGGWCRWWNQPAHPLERLKSTGLVCGMPGGSAFYFVSSVKQSELYAGLIIRASLSPRLTRPGLTIASGAGLGRVVRGPRLCSRPVQCETKLQCSQHAGMRICRRCEWYCA